MTNPRNESKTFGSSDREDNLVTGAEFRIFQHETQQTLCDIQAALARMTAGNNQGINNPPGHQHHKDRLKLVNALQESYKGSQSMRTS
jgi:hypothetical protein